MSELSNMVDEPEPETYYKNFNAPLRMPNAHVVPPNEKSVVVEEGKYTVAAADNATPPPLMPIDANHSTFAPYTTTFPSLASPHTTASASKSPKNFTVTIPITVHLPAEAFYRNFPTDASGRGRRVITTNLTYDVAVGLPETRTPSHDNSSPTPYVRPVNPWSSNAAQYRPTVVDEPGSLSRPGTGHDEYALDAHQSGRAGDRQGLGPNFAQNAPQLIKRPSEEEVMGHNWIKFQS